MRWKPFAVICALGVALCRPEPSFADPTPEVGRDLASEALAVFTARCTHCHGANLARPRGGFGYILDLKRLSANPHLIVPSRPDESELWLQVRNDEMPPPDSPTGPLTASEKEVIRAWIASGAPTGRAPAAQPSPSTQPGEQTDQESAVAVPLAQRTLRWLGKFHLLVLHFPIALLFAACAAESWSVWKRSPEPSGVVRFCLCLGATAAGPTVVLGWLYALGSHGAGSPELLALHRWLGTAAGLWVVATVLVSERDARRGVRSLHVRFMLLAGGVLVAAAAHFGGIMAHGEEFFRW
jgi:hypothetical protein